MDCKQSVPNQQVVEHADVADTKTEDEEFLFAADERGVRDDSGSWAFDSAASSMMTYDSRDIGGGSVSNKKVTVADGGAMDTTSIGQARIRASVGGKTNVLSFSDVLLCPALKQKLLSVSKLDDHGCQVVFGHGRVKVYDNKRTLVATGTRRGNLFYLDEAESAMRVADFR